MHNTDEYTRSSNDDEELPPVVATQTRRRKPSSPDTYQDTPPPLEIQTQWILIKSLLLSIDSLMKNENDTFAKIVASNVTELDISVETVDPDRITRLNPMMNELWSNTKGKRWPTPPGP